MVNTSAKHAREFIEIILYAGDKNADAPSLRHSVCVCIIIVFVTDDWRADGYRWRQGDGAKSNVFSDSKLGNKYFRVFSSLDIFVSFKTLAYLILFMHHYYVTLLHITRFYSPLMNSSTSST